MLQRWQANAGLSGVIRAAMQLGDDVLDVKPVERLVVLVTLALLATIACPVTDQLVRQGCH